MVPVVVFSTCAPSPHRHPSCCGTEQPAAVTGTCWRAEPATSSSYICNTRPGRSAIFNNIKCDLLSVAHACTTIQPKAYLELSGATVSFWDAKTWQIFPVNVNIRPSQGQGSISWNSLSSHAFLLDASSSEKYCQRRKKKSALKRNRFQCFITSVYCSRHINSTETTDYTRAETADQVC